MTIECPDVIYNTDYVDGIILQGAQKNQRVITGLCRLDLVRPKNFDRTTVQEDIPMENVTLPSLELFRGDSNAEVAGEAALLYQMGFVKEIQESPRYKTSIHALLATARIEMKPLTRCETVIWRAFLPQCMSMSSFIIRTLQSGGSLPAAVLNRYRDAMSTIAFESFEALYSVQCEDVVLLGRVCEGNKQYVLAQWNSGGLPPHTIVDVKKSLRERISTSSSLTVGFSSVGGVLDALDEHDKNHAQSFF